MLSSKAEGSKEGTQKYEIGIRTLKHFVQASKFTTQAASPVVEQLLNRFTLQRHGAPCATVKTVKPSV